MINYYEIDYYDELFKKPNAIQTTDTNNLFKKADYNTNNGEIKNKILDKS